MPGVKFFGVREQNSDVYYVHTSTNGSPEMILLILLFSVSVATLNSLSG